MKLNRNVYNKKADKIHLIICHLFKKKILIKINYINKTTIVPKIY